jgi:hypothetical protein
MPDQLSGPDGGHHAPSHTPPHRVDKTPGGLPHILTSRSRWLRRHVRRFLSPRVMTEWT